MSVLRRVGLRGSWMVLGLSLLASTALASSSAAPGAKATLEMEVRVEGAGHVKGAVGTYDRQDWKVLHQARLIVTLVAEEPTVDATPFAAIGAQAPDAADAAEDDESDWEQEWDDKLDACDGNEACEMRVTLQKMQDPRFQGAQQAVAQAMKMVQSGQASLDPSVQAWAMLGGGLRGTASVDQQTSTYGILDTGGGPAVDSHCRITGSATLEEAHTGYGDRHAVLVVNVATSTYELVLPADTVLAAIDDCDPGHQQQISLLGARPASGGLDWGEVLRVSGSLSGNASRPLLEGSNVWRGDLLPSHGAVQRPIAVTITWKLRPDAT